jgi:hypothetical protein
LLPALLRSADVWFESFLQLVIAVAALNNANKARLFHDDAMAKFFVFMLIG